VLSPSHIDASAETNAIGSLARLRLITTSSINQDILNHPSHFSPEDILVVQCSPQVAFKLRLVARRSSTLSGASPSLPGSMVLPIFPGC